MAVAAVHELMTRVHRSGNFTETLDAVTEGVLDLTGFGIAAISVVRSDGLAEMVSVAGPAEVRETLLGSTVPVWDLAHPDQPHEDWGLFRFIRHEDFRGWDGPVVLPRASGGEGPEAWHPYDVLLAPLRDAGKELIGFLHVDEPPGGVRPAAALLQRLDVLAVHAELAVRAQHERDAYEEQVRLARLGHRLTLAAARAADLSDLATEVVDLVCEEVQVDRVALRLVESEVGLPEGLWTSDGADAPPVPETLRRVAEHIAREALRAREVVAISLEKPDPALMPGVDLKALGRVLIDWGIQTLLIAPIGADQLFLGYLVLMRRGDHDHWTAAESKAVYEGSRDFATVALNRALLARSREYVAHLREVEEQKRVMFATVAHEFKGPIAAIAGNAELLADEVPDPMAGSVEAIARNARRLDALVADLMVLQQAEDPDRSRPRSAVDLWSVVREAVDVWRVQAAHKRVQLVLEPPPEPLHVHAQRTDLVRVVVNLVSNAVKYSRPGGEVVLRVEQVGEQVRFVCADAGIGIEEADLAAIFDEFVRGSHPDARHEPGSGLGLSIVRRLTDDLDGTVAVDSTPGRGSTFTVTLPLAAPTGEGGAR
ncbi:MAG TPA: ATP-binding protein [Marmoricola sp.]|nr:ATP-binding protein [Marmoricola sp.]